MQLKINLRLLVHKKADNYDIRTLYTNAQYSLQITFICEKDSSVHIIQKKVQSGDDFQTCIQKAILTDTDYKMVNKDSNCIVS